ncbi:MAG: ABC transporter permease [Thermoanaerobaculia bacterium]|nr:ABC transporter permease [Thermoanaerobaculia bacterium]
MTPGVRALPVVWAICRRTWLKILRRPVTLSFSLVQPLLWMAFFGFLFQRYEITQASKVRYLDFLVPGVCAMTVLFGASQSGIGWIRDLHSGFLQRMLQSPARPSALLAGKVAADVMRLLVQALAVLLLAWILGARVRVVGAEVLFGVLCLACFAAAFSSLSCVIALRSRAQEAMAVYVHLVNMPMLFTSSALVPTKQMPDWLARIAEWNPLTLTVDALRAGLLPQFRADRVAPVVLAILAALLFSLAAREMARLDRTG